MLYKAVSLFLAVLTAFMVVSTASAAAPPPALILVPEDVTRPIVFDAPAYIVAPDMEDFNIEASEQITLLTPAQADQLIGETFDYAGQIFGAMISIIAIGAGIALGFRIAREVRGFLSG